jgi:FAD/FMN-containing dehydrogenase/Fe-S oxidoreductase
VDEPQRQNIHDDLRGILKGELLFDELPRVLYSTDASIFQIQPLGVAIPQDEGDVQTLVRYAREHNIPLIPRGAGSGLAGESLGAGIIIDLSRHFRSILEIDTDTVRVQPGAIYQQLAQELAEANRRFAPDPASGSQCTIGGMVATNASGARLLRHGYTRDYVSALRVVLDTGDVVNASQHSRHGVTNPPAGHLDDVIVTVADLLEENAGLIENCRPRTPFNRCGYRLDGVLSENSLDLARLLVGSEGTLAIFTEATLRTVPLPGGRSLVVLGFETLDAALRAAQTATTTGPSACELLDHRLLRLGRDCDQPIAALIPPAVEVVVLVEYETDTRIEARQAALDLVHWLQKAQSLPLWSETVEAGDEIDRVWTWRGSAIANLYRLKGDNHPVTLIEDVGVPPEELSTYLHRVQDTLQRHETTASFVIHAGTGQVHTRPFLDLERPGDVSKLWAIGEEVHKLALDLGGTVSTQHGTGLARTPWVARQYGPLYPVFRELKAAFDPLGLFNPGKIVGAGREKLPWRLRSERPARALPQSEGSGGGENGVAANGAPPSSSETLRWQPGELRQEVLHCNGCGSCRTQIPSQRMCPIFRATHAEEATPRAKANLMRYLLDKSTDSRRLGSDEVRAVADLCVNCKMCARECPAHVNIPKLMLEAKAANVAEHGLRRSDWVLARTESFAAFGSALAFVVNRALASRTIRWLMEKFLGIARGRRLPTFAARSFLDRAERLGLTKPPPSDRPRVAYFVDVFHNYNDPLVAEAAVAVLRHNGIDVYVPPGQVGCGMAPLAQGDVDAAREAAKTNLRVLAELAREGYPIICSEPTAALMLQQDYLLLIDDLDARLVAERTVELTAFLWDLHLQGRLRQNFKPLRFSVGHHVPCHLKALGKPPSAPRLLALIPRLEPHTIDVSCSGMAGTFGLKPENYEVSLRAGRPMLQALAHPRIRFGSTECSTCRLQMEHACRKRTLHPVQYLALAYGLMPGLLRRLEEPIGELVLP